MKTTLNRVNFFNNINDAEFEDIFQNRIKPDVFRGASPSEHPKFVLIVGQPGSGKTVASERAENYFSSDGFININNDILMTYHPNYYKLTTSGHKSPYSAPEMRDVYSFASKAKSRLLDEAVNNKFNVVFENTFPKNTANFSLPQILDDRFKDIDLWIVATPNAASRISNYIRFESQKSSFNNDPEALCSAHKDGPRMLTDDNANDRFVAFRETITDLQNTEIAKRIRGVRILDRTGLRFETDNLGEFNQELKDAFLGSGPINLLADRVLV